MDIPIVPIILGSIPIIASGIYLFFVFNDTKTSSHKSKTHKYKEMTEIKQQTFGGTKKYKRI